MEGKGVAINSGNVEEKKSNTKKWISEILVGVLIAVVSMLLNVAANYIFIEDVTVTVSQSVLVEDEYQTIITLKNNESEVLENIELIISENELLDVSGAICNTDRVEILELLPNEKISVLVITSGTLEEIYPKSSELVFDVIYTSGTKDWILILKNAMIYALISSVFYILVAFWTNKKIGEVEEKYSEMCDELEGSISKLDKIELERKERISKSEDKIKQIKKIQKRQRVYYGIRISELNKELVFWRNVVKKALYTEKDQGEVAEKLIENVTDELKTYTTREKQPYMVEHDIFIANLINEGMDE